MQESTAPNFDLNGYAARLTDVPLALLRAELERRSTQSSISKRSPAEEGDDNADSDGSTCGSAKGGGRSYNTPIHVAALFLILILSTLACSFPILARRFPRLPIPRRFLFLSRHFGTGVLIATAFVHLLPTAFVSLTDPCLPAFWNKGYPAMAGLVAMVAVMTVVGIEMFFALRGAGHVHGLEYDTLIDHVGQDGGDYHDVAGEGHEGDPEAGSVELEPTGETLYHDEYHDENEPPANDSGEGVNPLLPKQRKSTKTTHTHTHNTSGSSRAFSFASAGDNDPDKSSNSDLDLQELDPTPLPHPPIPPPPPTAREPPSNPQKQLLQCLLLEAGILFHSVFIGMALSVATGASFVVLLVAISFHQTFEGFALGARISALIPTLFTASNPKPWLMALAYGATTPLGQALGLGLHNLYDPASTTGLLMVGMTNAFSSGLLLFAGLVELLAEDFLSDRSYQNLRGRSRLEACAAMAGGAFLMAIIGAFA